MSLCVFASIVISQVKSDNAGLSVTVAAAENTQLKTSVLASGNLKFKHQVELTPEVIGRVSDVLVEEGDWVEKGQALLEFDPSHYIAEQEQFEAQLKQQRLQIEQLKLTQDNEQHRFNRIKTLFDKKLIDEFEFIEQEYQLSISKVALLKGKEALVQAAAQLKQSQERLSKTVIKAPIAGTIISIDIKVGETAVASTQAFAGSNIMTIADTNSMIVELSVDESDIGKLALGQQADVFTAAFPEKAISGVVEHISISPETKLSLGGASKASKTYSVLVNIPNSEALALRPGMSCRTEVFQHQQGNSIVVPIEAVFESTDSIDKSTGYAIWIENDGEVSKRQVSLGQANDQYQEILQGLLPGENIVVGPTSVIRHLFDSAQVTINSGGF